MVKTLTSDSNTHPPQSPCVAPLVLYSLVTGWPIKWSSHLTQSELFKGKGSGKRRERKKEICFRIHYFEGHAVWWHRLQKAHSWCAYFCPHCPSLALISLVVSISILNIQSIMAIIPCNSCKRLISAFVLRRSCFLCFMMESNRAQWVLLAKSLEIKPYIILTEIEL